MSLLSSVAQAEGQITVVDDLKFSTIVTEVYSFTDQSAESWRYYGFWLSVTFTLMAVVAALLWWRYCKAKRLPRQETAQRQLANVNSRAVTTLAAAVAEAPDSLVEPLQKSKHSTLVSAVAWKVA